MVIHEETYQFSQTYRDSRQNEIENMEMEQDEFSHEENSREFTEEMKLVQEIADEIKKGN